MEKVFLLFENTPVNNSLILYENNFGFGVGRFMGYVINEETGKLDPEVGWVLLEDGSLDKFDKWMAAPKKKKRFTNSGHDIFRNYNCVEIFN